MRIDGRFLTFTSSDGKDHSKTRADIARFSVSAWLDDDGVPIGCTLARPCKQGQSDWCYHVEGVMFEDAKAMLNEFVGEESNG